MEGSAHERFDCEERGGEAPGGCDGRRPGSRAHAWFGVGSCGGGSHLTASASEQEAAAPLPAGTLAGSSQDFQDEATSADGGAVAPDDAEDPEADLQSAATAAADSTGSATGTTIKIAVYRSSYPLIWDLNDEGSSDVTKAQWDKPDSWPTEGSPGSAVGAYAGYTEADEPTRTGFAFLGWSAVADDPTVAGKLDTLEIPKGTEPVEGSDGVKSITLHALWAPIEYSVVFDLTKNPEDASAVPSFSWTTGKGTFTDLGGGRYRLSGVTLEDYDPERGLIEIATPSRGTGGYRFLSWAEPESQQSPTVAMQPAGTSTWYVNPVALTHYDYEPVLTARWSLSFDVDVPSQITFDQYDSLEIEGNLTDTTDEDVVDEESPDKHDAGKMAHFCSQSTAVDYKIVALKSEMQATASDILTTSDSSKATQEQVLSDEKLLSLFAANATSEDSGVHFRLTDTIDMDDSSRYGAFVIPKQTKTYSDTDYSRDDEERLYVSYRLNLSNRVDGASEPNHGLVTPANVNEGDRTPIAKVSYEFAVADGEVEKTIPGDPFYITDATGATYGLDYIKAAADDLSANGTASSYYVQFHGYMANGTLFTVRWGDGIAYAVRLIGINHDDRADGSGKAALTFQFENPLARASFFNYPICGTLDHMGTSANTFDYAGQEGIYGINDGVLDTRTSTWLHSSNAGGWGKSLLRHRMNPGTQPSEMQEPSRGQDNDEIWSQVPDALASIIVPVTKKYYDGSVSVSSAHATLRTTTDRLFLASYSEMIATGNLTGSSTRLDEGDTYEYWRSRSTKNGTNASLVKTQVLGDGSISSTPWEWWLRSCSPSLATSFSRIRQAGEPDHYPVSATVFGVVPCFCL